MTLSKYTETGLVLGTTIRIDYCHEDVSPTRLKEVFGKVWDRFEEIHWSMSSFDKGSDVSKINRSYPNEITTTEDIFFLLTESKRLSKLTMGAFDITVWPIISVWRKNEDKNTMPSVQEINAALAGTGPDMFVLKRGRTVQLLNPGTQIDLGGIAKGYAIDEAARIFRENGFYNFLIDAGGDLYAGGTNCQHRPWQIAIRDPRDLSQQLTVIPLKDAAIATSGDYVQFFEIQGQRFSHIINPATGLPQREIVSASVVGPNAMEADALATALCILTEKEGITVIDSLGKPFASLVLEKGADHQIIQYPSREFKGLSNF